MRATPPHIAPLLTARRFRVYDDKSLRWAPFLPDFLTRARVAEGAGDSRRRNHDERTRISPRVSNEKVAFLLFPSFSFFFSAAPIASGNVVAISAGAANIARRLFHRVHRPECDCHREFSGECHGHLHGPE